MPGEYLRPMIASVATTGLWLAAWYAVKCGDRTPLCLVMVGNASVAFTLVVDEYQRSMNLAWVAAAWGLTVVAALSLRELAGSARERRLWRQLFGETLWQLLLNDPRRGQAK